MEEGEAKRLRLDQEAAEQAPGGEHSGGAGGTGAVEVRRAGQFAGETI